MYVPLARSDYYGTSATTRRHRRTTHLPTTAAGGSDGSLPTFITVRSTGEAASSTPAASPRLRRSPSAWPPHRHRKTGFGVAAHWGGVRCVPAPICQVRAGGTVTGLQTLVSRVHLPISLAEPGPSDSAGPPRPCQGCSHPGACLRDGAALSFPTLLRQRRGRGLAPPPEPVTPRGAPRSCSIYWCRVGSGRQ